MSKVTMSAAVLVALLSVRTACAQGTETYEQSPINYSATQPRDAISRLQARLASGKAKFNGNGKEMVQTLLRELGLRAESQLLVFSKTSFQRGRIRPDQPRAIYFSDTCYVGWVPGGLIEVTTIDPKLGPIFYSFDPEPKERKFVRDSNCMTCHGGTFVRGIPGVFARSIFPSETGEPLLHFGSEVVDFRTPFTNRWGGWYVTGKHGTTIHRGNALAYEKDDKLVIDLKRGANLNDLSAFFDTESYLTTGSDIIALLVFEQQTAIQNTITRASFECRRMLDYQKALQRDLKEPVTEELTYDSVKRVFDGDAKDLVDDLLFKGEAELPAGLAGSAEFQKAFESNARRAKDGSSLKDLDLKGRLFRNRCSYLIYSESFLTLPQQLKQRVYARLERALRPENPLVEYAYLGTDERARIRSILQETHPEFGKSSAN